MWDKIKTWAKHSATVVWGYIQLAVAALDIAAHNLIDAAQQVTTDPTIQAQLQPIVEFVKGRLPPQWLGWLILGTGFITVLCRLRTLMGAVRKVGG